MANCEGKNKNGKPCQATALNGTTLCWRHGRPAAKKPGRPTKLTPEVQHTIIQSLSAGATRETASAHAGITPATFYHWMERGEAGEECFVDFFDAVKKADVAATVRATAAISLAMKSNWQAAAWYLERRCPETWGKRERHAIEHSGQVTKRVKLDLERLSDDQLEALEGIAQALED